MKQPNWEKIQCKKTCRYTQWLCLFAVKKQGLYTICASRKLISHMQTDMRRCLVPVNGRSSSVSGQERRVVDDGAVSGMVDHIHGNELGAEGHDVEFSAHGFVGFHHLRDWLPLHSPARELKHRCAVFFRCHSWWTGSTNSIRSHKDTHWCCLITDREQLGNHPISQLYWS